MSGKNTLSPVTRRQAVATVAVGVGLMAMPVIVRAQAPLTVKFVQQRGLLNLPVDAMVSGGILQQEATKLGLGKVEATVNTLSGPAPVIDAFTPQEVRAAAKASGQMPAYRAPNDALRPAMSFTR